MSTDTTIRALIKKPVSTVFRRAKIKRRSEVDGTFEDTWFEITDDVKSFGKISIQVDSARRFKFNFANAKLVVENEDGAYNPSDSPHSYWFGYLNQQRTLVKIEAGFREIVKDESGFYTVTESPGDTVWDQALWDHDGDVFDDDDDPSIFIGILSGDLPLSDKNDVTLNLKPLVSVFQDFPAKSLTGWTSTGCTASQFITMLRDQTDGSSNFIFRPFFDDDVANWDISTTTNIFANLNTSTAQDVIDKNVWEIIEKLAEVENFVPYVTRTGMFRFISRSTAESATSYEFYGAGVYSGEYGRTIKTIDSYGFMISKFYSRVQIKWKEASTATSYEIIETPLTVSPSNNPWVLGVRTLQFENLYIPTSTVANALAQTLFDDVSALKKEIKFTTTFIPHLDLFNRIAIYNDNSEVHSSNLWDVGNWASDATSSSTDLIWDKEGGDGMVIEGAEFKFLSIEIDLDNFQNSFVAREL